ncbi:MFS transporter [Spongiactinospora sp. 9N601]|uniref:MFS transporter n=1 Tax=Spongiactinospora sp. 9N601 TaxID=3375149 RepID=UPI0037928403
MRAMFAPLSIPVFRRVWAGQVMNLTGDAAYGVSVALLLLPREDAPRALGTVLGMSALGGIVSILVGGALADRHRRARIIIVSDLLRAAAVTGVLLAGPFAPLWLLGALSGLLGVGTGLYRPAYMAILPSLVPPDRLPGANALRSTTNRLTTLLGAAAGGALSVATSPQWALGVNVVTFVVGILTLAGVPEVVAEAPEGRPRLAAEIADGLRYVSSRTWMAAVMIQGTVQMALVAAPVALILPVLTGREGAWYGWIVAAEAAGAFLGAGLAAGIRSRSRGWIAMLALLAQAPQTVALTLAAHPSIILAASALTGAGLAVFAVLWTTALQTGVPARYLGRVFSVDGLATAGLSPVGYVVAGWLLADLGTATLAGFAGIALVVSIVAVLPIPGLRRFGEIDDRQPQRRISGEPIQ